MKLLMMTARSTQAVYQRRCPRSRGAPNLISLLQDDMYNNTSSSRGIHSTNISSDRGTSVNFVDLTSRSFDDNQIQPPIPSPTPPITYTGTSGAVAPPLSRSPSSSFPSPSLSAATDIEMIRTETVSSKS